MLNALEPERKSKDMVVSAIAYGEMQDLTVDDVFENGLLRLLSKLRDKADESQVFRAKLIKYGEDNAEIDEDGHKFIKYQYVEPFVGRQVFESAISNDIKPITINKKNIELRTDISLREFINNHIDANSNFQQWLDVIGNKSTYGLYDVSLMVIIYRVGRYSYYAVEPLCQYVERDMEFGK